MAGNEIKIVQFLLEKQNVIALKHIGLVKEIGAPNSNGGYTPINSIKELNIVSTEDAGKKADIYINGHGVSLKQTGGSNPFNRIQKADLANVLKTVGITDVTTLAKKIDKAVDDFHKGIFKKRNRKWQDIFSEEDFKKLLYQLMTKWSPNHGYTTHIAEYILEAPNENININNIEIYTIDEYYNKYKDKLFLAIRRVWFGQSSESEHNRAKSLMAKQGNGPWIYDNISGSPRKSAKTNKKWREEIKEKDRKTIYIVFIEKVK